jgi:hypothetical protein
MHGALERIGSAGKIARAFLRNPEQQTRPALRGKQLDGLAKRLDRSRRIFLRQQQAKIQIRLGHFGIDTRGAFVFRARFVSTMQRRERVGQLEMCVSDIRLFRDELLKRRDGALEIAGVDGVLRIIQQIIEGVGDLSRLRLPRVRTGCRLRRCGCMAPVQKEKTIGDCKN